MSTREEAQSKVRRCPACGSTIKQKLVVTGTGAFGLPVSKLTPVCTGDDKNIFEKLLFNCNKKIASEIDRVWREGA
ncbi:hypothetical protein [Methylobacter sp.]|uniref:hypothetical protein n=1 Tax=Methylobacter sp. TaxID=2051955 RepID=UPI0012170B44|nr:hypothetical protein [Methylobacter sp.]TAK59475.1 MAG: hypothetical protein EPO18_20140 [Methylobacter sp.]